METAGEKREVHIARPSAHRITARLFAWLAPLLFLFAALAAVPVSATASAKALRVPHNCTGEHSATAPFGMLPTIASPDWSKNLFVSNDPAHGISKFLGGQALTTLATAGASELPEALSSGTEDVLAAGGSAAKDAEAAGAGAAARSEVPPEAASGAKTELTTGTKAATEREIKPTTEKSTEESKLFSQGKRGTEPASQDLVNAVGSKGRSINYATKGSEELRYLDKMKANANVGGEKLTHILLRESPKKIEVLEEFLHGTQAKRGIIRRLGLQGAEGHVKDFMIRHAKLLGISPKDVEVLKHLLGG